MTSPQTWRYQSSWERKQRELAEFDAIADYALQSIADPDPMRMESARQTAGRLADRDEEQEQQRKIREAVAEHVRRQASRSPIERIASAAAGAGGAALTGIDRARQAGIGFMTGSNPVESVQRAFAGAGGERFSGQDMGFFRHLPEGSKARAVSGRFAEELADPLNYLIALKGPALAAKITSRAPLARAARMLLAPIVDGPAITRVGAEAGVATVGRYGGEVALERVPEDAHPALQVGAALGGGLIAAGGSAAAIGAAAAGARHGVRAVEEQALRSVLDSGLEQGSMSAGDRLMMALAERAADRRPRIAGAAEDTVQGGLEGIRPDQAELRAGERDGIPMFHRAEPSETGVVPQREILISKSFRSDELPGVEYIDRRIRQLEQELVVTNSGDLSRSKANRLVMERIAELEAARDVRAALDAADGNAWRALDYIEEDARRLREYVEARQAPGELARDAGDYERLAMRAGALQKFIDEAGIEMSSRPAGQPSFVQRHNIDIETPIPTPEEQSFRQAVARLTGDMERAGIGKSRERDALIERAAAGENVALRALQKQVSEARARQNKPDIRLKATLEETRQRGVVTRRNAADDLQGVDLTDSLRAARLAEGLGITDIQKPIAAKFATGKPLTERQSQTFLQQVLGRMERMEPEARARALRDAGYEPPALPDAASRMNSPEVKRILEEAGFVEHDGRWLAGPSGDFVAQAKRLLPEDSYVLRLASGEGVPSGSTLEHRPPPNEPPRSPPGGPGDAGGPFDPGDPGARMPERGFGGADWHISKMDEVYRDPGRISKSILAAAERAGVASVVKRIVSMLAPYQLHVRRVMVAYNAESNVFAQLSTQFKAVKLGILRRLEGAWDNAPPVYHGPADNPFRGMPVDFLENPQWYSASDELIAMARAWADADLDMLATVRGLYNVDILPFIYEHTGGTYIPHIERRLDFEAAFTQTMDRLYASGRRKHRSHETLYDRWKSAQAKGEKFEPETNLDTLQIHHAEALARMAAQETFIRGSGGLTRIQFIDAAHPGLRARRDAAKKRVDNIHEQIKTAFREGKVDARESRRIAGRMTALEKRAKQIIDRLDDLGYEGGTHRISEWGPELAHEAGRLREAGLQWRHLRAELIRRGESVASIEKRYASLNREYDAAVKELEGLRAAYDSAAKPGTAVDGVEYVQSTHTLRWHPADEARAIDTLYRATDPNSPLGRLQLGMEHWRGAVVTLDATYTTIQGMFAALSNGPIGIRPGVEAFIRNARDPDRLAKIAREEPELASEFARVTGNEWPFRGRERTPAELARGRGIEAIRYKGIGQIVRDFNDMQWRAVTEIVYNAWKKDRAWLMEQGLNANQAGFEAANVLWKIVPRMNPRRSGRSLAHAQFERMLVISPSFVYQPAIIFKDAATAMAKMAVAKGSGNEAWGALLPHERLAFKRYVTLMSTMMGISATSAVIFAPLNKQSPDEALLEVMNPRSSKFMGVVFGRHGTVALGGAHRAMIRMLAPRTDADGNLVPLQGLAMFLKGKQHPALRMVLDQYAGRDYFGNDIEEGRLPVGLANRLWYAAESGMPIWTQPISAAGRGSPTAPQSLAEGMIQAAFGTVGYAYYERSPFEQLDRIARGRYGDSFHNLPPASQAQLREEFPDLWAASIRRGREQRQQYQRHLALVNSQQQESDRMLASGEITRERWLADFRARQQMLAGYREAIFAESPQSDRNTPIDRYFDQIELAKGPDGMVDWDLVDAWKSSLSAADQEYIEENTGVSRTVLGRAYRQVAKTYAEYLSLPKYRGFDADEAREIDAAWQQVRNLAAEIAMGREIERRHMLIAYRELGSRLGVSDDIDRAVRLRILGRLPQLTVRQQFRRANPDIELFYGRGPLTDMQRERIIELARQTMRSHEDDVMRELAELLDINMPALRNPHAELIQALRDRIAAER